MASTRDDLGGRRDRHDRGRHRRPHPRALGRRRRVAWEDVADVHRHGRMVYLRTVSGELVPVLGMPSRRYRRERYRGPGRLTDHVIADLRSRIPAGRHGG